MLRPMSSWDRRTPKQLAARRVAAVRAQVVDAVGPFSPYWRERLLSLGRTPAQAGTLAGLPALPAAGERDVCPDGDPAGAGSLVLQAGERDFALHAEGPMLRRALRARLVSKGSYRAVVEADTRPTSYVWAGLGLRFPVASTRSDLDVVARAGARLWQVLGLTRADVLVAALPLSPTAALQALQYAALGAGSPALFPGAEPDQVAAALALVPATVLALDTPNAAVLLNDLDEAGPTWPRRSPGPAPVPRWCSPSMPPTVTGCCGASAGRAQAASRVCTPIPISSWSPWSTRRRASRQPASR